jgi:hypothetical protein
LPAVPRRGNAKTAKAAQASLYGVTRGRSTQRPHTQFDLRALRALRFIAIVAALMSPRAAAAHPVPFSYLDLRLAPGAIEGSLVAHIFDLAHDLQIEPVERLLEPRLVAERANAIIALLTPRLIVAVDGQPLRGEWSQVELLPERQSVRVRMHYGVPSTPGRLAVATVMFPYDPQHQTFLNIYEGEALTQAILDNGRTEFEYFAGTWPGTVAVVQKFLPAGVHRILIGPAHLLFLVGLLLLGGSIRQLAVVVAAFAVAHSITLSLAALNFVTPPPRIIEPAVALSIVYVGADNLLVRGGRDMRAWIAFAFGFIHGFGFANVLREMDLPARGVAWSLFSFNVGVEIGQLMVVIVVASALMALRSRNEAVGRQIAFAGSLVVIAAGAFWFIQRVFFPGGLS